MLQEALSILATAGIPATAATRFGEPALRLETESGILVISLLGAQVLEWHPRGAANPLWLTRETLHAPGNPIRGGIPLCWPWFGSPHAPFDGPSHGFARRRHWKLVSAVRRDDDILLHWQLEVSGDDYRLHADYHITAGDTLALQLTTTNLGNEPCAVTPAFHPYFAVSALREADLRFRAALQPLDRLTQTHQQATETLAFDGGEIEVQWTPWVDVDVVRGANAGLHISSDSATHCVAWNPGPDKSRGMSDLDANAFEQFICVEPGRLDAEKEQVLPGGKTTIAMTMAVFRRN